MKRLGERIKKKRENQKLQLNDLARRAGISPSALSQIENAKASPSIVTLKNIAECLHTTVGELIGENENLSQNPLITREEIKFIEKNASGSELYLLSNHDPLKRMETYLIRFAGNSDIEGFFPAHRGQTFCFVNEGTFVFHLDEVDYPLKKGDSFYFDTVLSHRVHLLNADRGELVWVTTSVNG
ncbi:MAG TPA: XRE family transcriptional regulator [Prolixibacteraceae bacterium]|nr:XRE family transcriptional regulator [Prolixibacteraceae bacterium]